jgi:para-aminobenzoate synthetase component 1
VSYEYAHELEPRYLQPPRPDPAGLPRRHFTLYGKVDVLDAVTGTLHSLDRRVEGADVPPGEPLRPERGPFRARKVLDTESGVTFGEKVQAIRDAIRRGDVYQVNLTRQESWEVRGALPVFARRLFDANPAPFSAFIADRRFQIVSSSPERFLRRENGHVFSQPIKGTAPRSGDPAEDRRLADALLACPKNRSELAMIVDLIRNDLSRFCVPGSVRVESFPSLESFANVHHLVATVAGEPGAGAGLGETMAAMFPCGSITGCPKLSAMRFIREIEPAVRGVYTGAVGWVSGDGLQMDFNVAIRTCTVADGLLRFGVGGGIVWDSDPRDEYEETVHKGASIVRCLTM